MLADGPQGRWQIDDVGAVCDRLGLSEEIGGVVAQAASKEHWARATGLSITPDPRIFRLALDALAVSAGESVYVGDIYDVDVVGARAAGMEGVLYDRWGAFGDLAVRRIERLSELLTV